MSWLPAWISVGMATYAVLKSHTYRGGTGGWFMNILRVRENKYDIENISDTRTSTSAYLENFPRLWNFLSFIKSKVSKGTISKSTDKGSYDAPNVQRIQSVLRMETACWWERTDEWRITRLVWVNRKSMGNQMTMGNRTKHGKKKRMLQCTKKIVEHFCKGIQHNLTCLLYSLTPYTRRNSFLKIFMTVIFPLIFNGCETSVLLLFSEHQLDQSWAATFNSLEDLQVVSEIKSWLWLWPPIAMTYCRADTEMPVEG